MAAGNLLQLFWKIYPHQHIFKMINRELSNYWNNIEIISAVSLAILSSTNIYTFLGTYWYLR